MAKGDDALQRKRNKAARKKVRARPDTSSAAVSARVATLIAAKKRRKSGLRRKCQGMCFSLPTPDDPFNDRNGKKDFFVKKDKETSFSKDKKASTGKRKFDKDDASLDNGNGKAARLKNGKVAKTRLNSERSDCPSKYLLMCLHEIESSLRNDGTCDAEDKPWFASSWGIEFWKCYSAGKDMLDGSGSCSTVERIGWIVSTAADAISRKDEEGLSGSSPFLLFLVPSQEKAVKARAVCKSLKVHGVHTVSIHPGASLEHQIQGLKNCEPEFLISTPGRLLELISSKAIDISGVSLLVVDGAEANDTNGYIDSVKAITKSLSENTRRLVFNGYLSPSDPLLQSLLTKPVHRL